MLTYLSSSIWASSAQALINAEHVVGAMGKGIALSNQILTLKKSDPQADTSGSHGI